MTAIVTPITAFSAVTSRPSPSRNSAFQTHCGTNTMTKPEMRNPATTSVHIIDHSLRYWFPSLYQPPTTGVRRALAAARRPLPIGLQTALGQNRSVSPPSVTMACSSVPIHAAGRIRRIAVVAVVSLEFRANLVEQRLREVRWTMTAMTAMRTSPPRGSATRNSQPSRIRIINPSSTMRFVGRT